MKIEFVGAARSVTGSCFIIKTGNHTLMVDHGMFQGNKSLRERNFLKTIYAPSEIDALILTHAHIDHSGLIPKMVKDGFNQKIYATKATVDLCSVMLPDSAHIQEMDVKWINKKNKHLGIDESQPLYTVEDAEESMRHFVPVNYGEEVEVLPGITARFRDAGHILGSAFVELRVKENGREKKLVFSGDIGPKDQALIRDPEKVSEADVLFIESTYGDRLHKSREDTFREFTEIINDAYKRKGNIIIPSFAVERTQEIIFTLGRLFKEGAIPRIPVYIDSPLAISATEIFKMNRDCFDEATMKILLSGDNPLDFETLHYTRDTADSKRLNEEARGAIIISASGMCNAGRIKFHLLNNLYRSESSIVFVGYQAEGTLGRQLVDGAKKVRVLGEEVVVHAKIHTLGGFSAHADRDGLIDWMSTIENKNPRVFVVHGEETASIAFASTVQERLGWNAEVPRWGEIIDLETGERTFASYGIPRFGGMLEKKFADLRDTLGKLEEKYKKAVQEKKYGDEEKIEHQLNDIKRMMQSLIEDL